MLVPEHLQLVTKIVEGLNLKYLGILVLQLTDRQTCELTGKQTIIVQGTMK